MNVKAIKLGGEPELNYFLSQTLRKRETAENREKLNIKLKEFYADENFNDANKMQLVSYLKANEAFLSTLEDIDYT